MNIIDLHTHTIYSDGTYTPTELIKYAVTKNIKALAITDHDTVDGINEALEYSKQFKIEIISGIEISAEYEKKEIHIVGLFINQNSQELLNTLIALKEKRYTRNIKMIEALNKYGFNVTYEELEKTSQNKIITRAHFAKLMLEKGYVKSIKESFDKYLSEGKPTYISKELLKPQESINIIKKSGGSAIIAHPLLYNFDDNELNIMLKYLKACGLVGIECYYPSHTPENTKYLIELANKYNLKISGGSDFHGNNKPWLNLGTGYNNNLKIPYEILENLKRGEIYDN